MGNKTALIITYYKYPGGDAGSFRQESFAKIFKELGYETTVIGMGTSTNYAIKEHKGIKYASLRGEKTTLSERIKNYILYKYRLKEFINNNNISPAVILVNDIPVNALLYIRKYAKKHSACLLHDSVEWYSPEQFKHKNFSYQYIVKDRLNKKWINKNFSVIAISRFLEEHFKSKGIKTIRVPVILDIEHISFNKRTDENKTVFLYAGAPGKKDYLKEIIAGFARIDFQTQKHMELRIIGVNRQQLVADCDVNSTNIEKLGESLVLLGRISHENVLENLKEADYTVLMRSETLRYAKAGFPTKVVESLASSTPVITNITSDLGDYLIDNENSLIISECSPEALAVAVRKALAIDYPTKIHMQQLARKCAEDNFDYKHYLKDIEWIIGNHVI